MLLAPDSKAGTLFSKLYALILEQWFYVLKKIAMPNL